MAKKPRRARTQAQIDAELRREENDRHGKTLVRHTKESSAALAKLQKRLELSGPEVMRLAVVELAAKTSGKK